MFIVHYPRVMWEGTTESRVTLVGDVESGQTRNDDKYGHWPVVLGGMFSVLK